MSQGELIEEQKQELQQLTIRIEDVERPPYRPVPQFNHHSAKENEHERIDLHPLRRLLHPRSETFRAAGGRYFSRIDLRMKF